MLQFEFVKIIFVIRQTYIQKFGEIIINNRIINIDLTSDKRWDNYYPFVLSLKPAESLYSFLNGEVFLIVILDGHEMKRMAKKMGYDLEIAMTKNEGFIFYQENIKINFPTMIFVTL